MKQGNNTFSVNWSGFNVLPSWVVYLKKQLNMWVVIDPAQQENILNVTPHGEPPEDLFKLYETQESCVAEK